MGLQQYLKDTQAELHHVAWPTRTQTTVYTVLVIGLSVFVAAYLGLFDYLFQGSVRRFVEANAGSQSQSAAETASTSAPTTLPTQTQTPAAKTVPTPAPTSPTYQFSPTPVKR